MRVSFDEGEARRLLQEERTRLQQIRAALGGETTEDSKEDALGELAPAEADRVGSGAEMVDRDRDLAVLEHIDAQLAAVDHAMKRLEEGSYGMCEACGRPIDEDRLRARPAARLCLEDQAKTERAR